MEHFNDCPHKKYDICTCDMSGEEMALVNWQIKKQEGKLKWYDVVAKLSTMGSPEIPFTEGYIKS